MLCYIVRDTIFTNAWIKFIVLVVVAVINVAVVVYFWGMNKEMREKFDDIILSKFKKIQ